MGKRGKNLKIVVIRLSEQHHIFVKNLLLSHFSSFDEENLLFWPVGKCVINKLLQLNALYC